jgi:hypothetical protein
MSRLRWILTGLLCLAAIGLFFMTANRDPFAPPSDPSDYQERLELARAILAPGQEKIGDTFLTSVAPSIDETMVKIEERYPQIVADHRQEIRDIHAAWPKDVEAFAASEYVRFFAERFTADDLRAMQNKNRMPSLADLRRFVTWKIGRDEFDNISERIRIYSDCRFFAGVLPALGDLGIPNPMQDPETRSMCANFFGKDWIPPIDAPK